MGDSGMLEYTLQDNPYNSAAFTAEDFADDGKLALEDASGTMPIEIFDDGGSMIFVEGRRLFTIAFTFRRFLPAIAQVRQEIVAAWP